MRLSRIAVGSFAVMMLAVQPVQGKSKDADQTTDKDGEAADQQPTQQ